MRRMFLTLFTMLVVALPSVAVAQYPTRSIRVIVPNQAGSAGDTVARLIAERLAVNLGQAVVIENRTGANGNIGVELAARASNDGYTLLLANSNAVGNMYLYEKVNYDIVKDFVPVSLLARMAAVLVVPADSPAKSVQELIALAKAKAGGTSFASGGNGSIAHFAAELFKSSAGIDALHVPYKGSPDIMFSLISRQTDFAFPVLSTGLTQIRAGKLRALGVTGLNRSPHLPNVPTMREALSPGFDIDIWLGLLAPAGVSKDVIARLNTEIVKILREPAVRDRLSGDGYDVMSSSSIEFANLIEKDLVMWSDLVKKSGARIN